ncbi:uncharacterized protein B0I36DRAFT_356278 [Microdochium trichocladiopsis]|uniref:Uncharacterized protein n=1 Tax=Microdochium trichocladiopsis TaxID=1682393 RepID=A0A9P9BII5_9PEZI|nr:uncharacterized protein B0I36DRAFT_356278 [Microdochium trichocladiopsis]KAH7012197.1 hypothetical protein B0I36DRAFT_356278 [Microdochium trichocladiopsis]
MSCMTQCPPTAPIFEPMKYSCGAGSKLSPELTVRDEQQYGMVQPSTEVVNSLRPEPLQEKRETRGSPIPEIMVPQQDSTKTVSEASDRLKEIGNPNPAKFPLRDCLVRNSQVQNSSTEEAMVDVKDAPSPSHDLMEAPIVPKKSVKRGGNYTPQATRSRTEQSIERPPELTQQLQSTEMNLDSYEDRCVGQTGFLVPLDPRMENLILPGLNSSIDFNKVNELTTQRGTEDTNTSVENHGKDEVRMHCDARVTGYELESYNGHIGVRLPHAAKSHPIDRASNNNNVPGFQREIRQSLLSIGHNDPGVLESSGVLEEDYATMNQESLSKLAGVSRDLMFEDSVSKNARNERQSQPEYNKRNREVACYGAENPVSPQDLPTHLMELVEASMLKQTVDDERGKSSQDGSLESVSEQGEEEGKKEDKGTICSVEERLNNDLAIVAVFKDIPAAGSPQRSIRNKPMSSIFENSDSVSLGGAVSPRIEPSLALSGARLQYDNAADSPANVELRRQLEQRSQELEKAKAECTSINNLLQKAYEEVQTERCHIMDIKKQHEVALNRLRSERQLADEERESLKASLSAVWVRVSTAPVNCSPDQDISAAVNAYLNRVVSERAELEEQHQTTIRGLEASLQSILARHRWACQVNEADTEQYTLAGPLASTVSKLASLYDELQMRHDGHVRNFRDSSTQCSGYPRGTNTGATHGFERQSAELHELQAKKSNLERELRSLEIEYNVEAARRKADLSQPTEQSESDALHQTRREVQSADFQTRFGTPVEIAKYLDIASAHQDLIEDIHASLERAKQIEALGMCNLEKRANPREMLGQLDAAYGTLDKLYNEEKTRCSKVRQELSKLNEAHASTSAQLNEARKECQQLSEDVTRFRTELHQKVSTTNKPIRRPDSVEQAPTGTSTSKGGLGKSGVSCEKTMQDLKAIRGDIKALQNSFITRGIKQPDTKCIQPTEPMTDEIRALKAQMFEWLDFWTRQQELSYANMNSERIRRHSVGCKQVQSSTYERKICKLEENQEQLESRLALVEAGLKDKEITKQSSLQALESHDLV